MIWNIQKFDSEIKALKRLSNEDALHPLRKEQLKASVMLSLDAPMPLPAKAFFEPSNRLIKYLISILIGLGLVGGTALASQGSIPGSALYPIKRAVEKLETGLAISTDAKARVETKHAERRFQELAEIESQTGVGVDVVIENSGDNSNANVNANDARNLQATSSVAVQASSSLTLTDNSPSKEKNSRGNKVKLQARQDAQDQLSRAKDSLNRAKAKLEAKGNTQAAWEMAARIKSLEAKAVNVGIEEKLKMQADDGEQNTNGGGESNNDRD